MVTLQDLGHLCQATPTYPPCRLLPYKERLSTS